MAASPWRWGSCGPGCAGRPGRRVRTSLTTASVQAAVPKARSVQVGVGALREEQADEVLQAPLEAIEVLADGAVV